MTRLSPAERARQAQPARKRKPQLQVRAAVKGIGSTGGQRIQAWFERALKAQSIHFYRLLGVTLFLVVFGVIMVLSASSVDSLVANRNAFAVFLKQAGFAIIGVLLMTWASTLSTGFIRSKVKFLFVASMAAQVLVLFIGKDINGNRNWIDVFGLFSFQPSEFLKIAVILHVAAYLAFQLDNLDLSMTWWRAVGISSAAMGLVFLGKDLGTVIIMLIAFFGLLALAGMPNKIMQRIGLALLVLIPAGLTIGSSSRIGRITAWLNPNAADPNNYNWQSEHGIWAIAAGRIFGAGLGESKMKWSWIPEVENDFIFAIIAEELGLIGATVVILLFIVLAFSFLKIYQRTRDEFSKFVVGAVMIWIIFQALVNIAVVLRLLPVLGVPLPLISAGGSSLVATLLAVGIVLSIERENNVNPAPARSRRVR